MGYWEAKAKYEDGSEVCYEFYYSADEKECEQQYLIECWLLERYKSPAVWYSVNYVSDEEE